MTVAGDILAAQVVDGIAVKPATSPAPNVEHMRRSEQEIAMWRRRPFIIIEAPDGLSDASTAKSKSGQVKRLRAQP